LTVDWGDGSASEVFNYAAGTTSFSETHQYLDDNPTATPLDSYMINVTLSDGAANDTDSAVVTVNNLPPTLSNLAVSPLTLQVGDSTSLSGDVNDAGTLDSHTVTISWGDGSANTTLNLAAGETALSATHQYTATGSFDISVTATDDDTGSVNASAGSVTVNAPPPPPTLPNAPTNLTATRAASRTQIDLTWTDNSNNEDGFKIERCSVVKGKCNFSEIAQTSTDVFIFPDTGLSKNKTYYYRVRAFNTSGDSAYSNTASAKTLRK
jgi:predicted phage tail protein